MGAQREASFAEVIGGQRPLRAFRRLADAQQLVQVPIGHDLEAERVVVLDPQAIQVVIRLDQVRRHHGPIQDGHAAQEQEIVAAGRQVLVVHRRLAGFRIDDELAGQRVAARRLHILKRDLAGLQPVAGHADAAGGDSPVGGAEVILIQLLEDFGFQPDQSLVTRRRRQDLGVQHDSTLLPHVVVHPFGVDDPVALAKDDVAFQVEFQRRLFGLQFLAGRLAAEIQRIQAGGPDDDPVGLDVDLAVRQTRHVLDSGDHHVDPRRDRGDRLAAVRAGEHFALHPHVAARADDDPPHRGWRVGLGSRHRFVGRARRRRGRSGGRPQRRPGHGTLRRPGDARRCGGRRRHPAGQPGRVLGQLNMTVCVRLASLPATQVNVGLDGGFESGAGRLHADLGRRVEAAEPLVGAHGIGTAVRLAMSRAGILGFHRHVAFQVSQHAAKFPVPGVRPLDPQHGFFAARGQIRLDDLAVAAEHPDLVFAFLPPIGLARRGRDLGTLPRQGQGDLGGKADGGQQRDCGPNHPARTANAGAGPRPCARKRPVNKTDGRLQCQGILACSKTSAVGHALATVGAGIATSFRPRKDETQLPSGRDYRHLQGPKQAGFTRGASGASGVLRRVSSRAFDCKQSRLTASRRRRCFPATPTPSACR